MRVIDSEHRNVVTRAICTRLYHAARDLLRWHVQCFLVGRSCLRIAACLTHTNANSCIDERYRHFTNSRIGIDISCIYMPKCWRSSGKRVRPWSSDRLVLGYLSPLTSWWIDAWRFLVACSHLKSLECICYFYFTFCAIRVFQPGK